MEKSSEPTLAPQWLRSTRHVTSFVSASSPLRPDDPAPLKLANSRLLSMNMNNKELRNTAASDRAVQSHARWSSNSSTSPNFRSYNSFRSHRYRDMDKDINKYREASTLRNPKSRDLPDTSSKHCWETFKEEGLGRSQSMISGRISEKWPTNLSNAGKIKLTENKGLLSVSGVDKAIDRGIRPLVTEQRQASPRLERVESPGLGTMTRTLPTGALRTTDNKSASALADIAAVAGNSNSGPSSMKQGASSGPSSPISSKSIGRVLSMAETVAKGPSRVQTTSQLSNANQRLEELAVKQSRQLIPLKSLVTKASVSNPSDKPRTKVELLQQTVSSSPPVSPSLSSKLHRRGVSSGMNGSLSPNTHSKGSNVLLTIPPANIAASSASGHKPVGTMVEKKLSSQARGRNDFFNLMRKKSIGSSSAVSVEGSVISPSSSYNSGVSEVLNAHGIPQDQDFSLSDDSPRAEQSTEILGENTCNSESSDGKNSTDKSSPKSEAILRSEEEEEAAFMRSLGWEENSDEGGLTEEEISAFYKDVAKYINSKLSYKVMQGVQSLLSLHSGIGDVGVISS